MQADPGPSHAMTVSQHNPVIYGVGESEADDLEQQGPPKKKRRRQALSCTGDYLHSFVIRPVLFYSDLPGLFFHYSAFLNQHRSCSSILEFIHWLIQRYEHTSRV